MNATFSDDKQYVYVDEYIYSVEDFIVMYGEDALPKENKGEQQFSYEDYYDAFLKLLDSLGKFAHAYKLLQNAKADNNPQVNKVRDKYYKSNGELAREVEKRKKKCWFDVKRLDLASQEAGWPPTDEKSQRNLLNFLYQKKRRTYFRRRIRNFKDKNEPCSIIELYNLCIKAQGAR